MLRLALLPLVFFLAGSPLAAQPPALRPGRLPAEEVAALKPGWVLILTAGEASDRRVARLPSLYVVPGQPVSPFLPVGAFAAQWTGYLKAGIRVTAKFQFEGTGSAALTINGVPVLRGDQDLSLVTPAEVELVKGYNAVVLAYTPPATGAARFRLLWSGEGYGVEPLPPEVLVHDSRLAELAKSRELRTGRELFATRHCSACHELEGDTKAPGAMPELSSAAPNLQTAGARLETAWLARWVLDPRALQPHATMPRLLGRFEEKEEKQHAADLAAFVVTLTDDEQAADAAAAKPEATDDETIGQGRRLFENLGCIACHRTSEPDAEDARDRRPLHFVAAKYKPGALAAFLQSPHKHYASSRMPDFRLSATEAGSLAAFLRKEAIGTVEPLGIEGDIDRGHALFGQLGCNNCHPVKVRPMVDSLAAAAVLVKPGNKGCLAAAQADRGAAPDYQFNAGEQPALRAFLGDKTGSLWREPAVEYAERQIERMRCTACHRRDGQPGVLTSVLEDEGTQGLVPEILPLLTWTGEKLRPVATSRLIRGQPEKARHWLKARMPGFTVDAPLLAAGFAHEHGVSDQPEEPLRSDPILVETGRRLIQTQGGLDCVKCHALGDKPAVAPFEAPGINLAFAAGRLRNDYYHRWMIDPVRIDVQVKMPKFSQDGETTGIREVYGGDARKQYEAIWHFLNAQH